mgnify:CR=1 FL=1
MSRAWAALQENLSSLIREIAKFGVVGLLALVVDIGLLRLLGRAV